ncbi:MAG: DUF116 domain-containing protein [Gemmataceae bacterium]|nr:DUF116 domain-containing protein [Gemmataceae bacterium]
MNVGAPGVGLLVPTASPAPASPREKKDLTAKIKVVPETRLLRDQVRAEAALVAAKLDRSKMFNKDELRAIARGVLDGMGLGHQYTGFTAVCVANEFWRSELQAIPYHRRLLLLPHCLKHAEGCPADYDDFGLDCEKCGACSVADFKTKAEKLGYKVLVSEGTPIVLKIIVSGHVDAIVGVACLNVLEKALDKIILAGVPCVAAPLLSSNCKSTSVDIDWVMEMIDLKTPEPEVKSKSYIHLLRAANSICDEPELTRLVPRARAGKEVREGDPLRQTEAISYDWLSSGGKRSRPFITLAAFDAMRGAPGTRSIDGLDLPDQVKRAAVAMEVFHKASLIHDDIQDDDPFRYGMETLHKRHGVGPAINFGDYLIGWGYRLIAKDRALLGADVAADLLARLADAHVKLAEGQGAELLWKQSEVRELTTIDALRLYALKTSPAFEAALYTGIRLAGPAEAYEKMVAEFSKNLGIAFQILNDLDDFEASKGNKVIAARDVVAGRPTLLLALALEGLKGADRQRLLDLIQGRVTQGDILSLVIELYEKAEVFAKAEKLIEKLKNKAFAIADETQPEALRDLLYHLIDSVLQRQVEEPEADDHLVPPVPLLQLNLVSTNGV